MHCLIFLHADDNFLKCSMINDAVYAKLSLIKMNLNENFIKLIKDFITHDFYDLNHFNAFYMIKKTDDTDLYYIKEFLKLFYFNTVVNENEYLKYK